MSDQLAADFFSALNGWTCDGYSLALNYLALQNTNGEMRLLRAAMVASPVPGDEARSFTLRSERIAAGSIVRNNLAQSEIVEILSDLSCGIVIIDDEAFAFASSKIDFQSDLADTVRWEYDLHLRVNAPLTEGCKFDVASIDREFRTLSTPFDGLPDITGFLSLGGDRNPPTDFAKAELIVKPPVDCMIGQTTLSNDVLRVSLLAHPAFSNADLSVAVRATPGVGLSARRQVATDISWIAGENGFLHGTGEIHLQNSDSALIMLSLAGKTVRRQWFLDPIKARNARVFAAKHFDPDFRQLRRALLEDRDGPRFELGISALLFLLGFAPAVQVETEAPDILVASPAGRLVLIECTLKISDFRTKLGKLVGRRASLGREMNSTGHITQMYAVLICRAPRDQLVIDEEELRYHGVVLLTQPDIENGLLRLNGHTDPDQLLSELTPDVRQ